MSSSSSSSSSSDGHDQPVGANGRPFGPLSTVRCPVTVILGTGTISVRRCLALGRASVVTLVQSAGEDLQVVVNGVLVGRGEVVIVEDSTAIRVTEIARNADLEARG